MAIQNPIYGKELSETEAASLYIPGTAKDAPLGVPSLDEEGRLSPDCIPALTTQVGFGGELITVPYTGSSLSLPLPIDQGGTGTINAASALSALGGQPTYPILTTICSNASTGFIVKDNVGVAQIRTIQVNNPLTISNASGITGNPTISLSQGVGSGLNAEFLNGAPSSSYFRVDGSISYTTETKTTIRGSLNAASSGANTDITSLGTITGLGNTSTSHITIASSGEVGIGESSPSTYGGKTIIRGGVAGTNTSSLAIATPNGNNLRACISLWSTFSNYPADQGIRRTADIIAGFNGWIWGSEYLSFNVGSNATSQLTQERVRIDGSGNILVGTTVTTANAGDVQISRGITFPATQVPCSDVNTLDDYEEGTWSPTLDSTTPGTGRATTVHYARYTKIGNLVTFSAYVSLATLGSGGSGGLVINGLPYTSASGAGQPHWGATVPYFAVLKVAVMCLGATVQPNSTQIAFRGWSTAQTSVAGFDFPTYVQAGSAFIVSGFYYTS